MFAWSWEANIGRFGDLEGAKGRDLEDILALTGLPLVLRRGLHDDIRIDPGCQSSQPPANHMRERTNQSKGG